ncbi:hypothetical protein CR103_18090 [Massilia psychrophila]|uniref:Uncharacterized protein n=1 Tax=Massilia psychrophila TaxID=1603353 RepID=A0A2G8SXH1_9BURK|nr:hypothetical protein CR103_18090 [Massilia psychrophila]
MDQVFQLEVMKLAPAHAARQLILLIAKHMPLNFRAKAMDGQHARAHQKAETVRKPEHRALRRVRLMEQVGEQVRASRRPGLARRKIRRADGQAR